MWKHELSLKRRVECNELYWMYLKTVIATQLKNTIAKVFSEDKVPRINREDNTPGEPVDMIFSTKSIYNRIVNSPFLVGMSNTILIEGSKQVADIYFKNK